MARTVSLIQQARIATPCEMKWQDMTGDDRVRYCSACKLNVFDFAAMSEDEANELLRSTEGRVCGRLWRRRDGTVITRDCPVGLRAVRRKMIGAAASIAAAFVVAGTAIAFSRSGDESRWRGDYSAYQKTRAKIDAWMNGTPPLPGRIVMGEMMVAPTPANGANGAGSTGCSTNE